MDDFVKLIISLSISGGIMAIVLFALKPILRNRLSKSFQYYIWLIVLVRLAMPFTFEINLVNTLMNDATEAVAQSQQTPAAYNFAPENVAEDTPAKTTDFPNETQPSQAKTSVNYLFIIWLAGMVVSLGWSLISYFRFEYVLKRSHNPAKTEETALLKSLCGKRKVTLCRNPLAKTPMLIDIFRPKIILPEAEYTDDGLRNILSHELIHLRRFDIVIRWITTIVAAAHWFNPIVYFMRREINRACELSCDEAVIKTLDRDGKQSYGETLISVVAESRYPYGVISTTMCEEKKTLKERLTAIMKYKTKSKTVIIISVVLLLVLSAGALALGANIKNGPENNTEEVKTESLFSYDLDELWKYATPYVGDNSKVGGIVSLLPVPDNRIQKESIELQTSETPYGLTIYYAPVDKTAVYDQSDFGETPNNRFNKICRSNALILFGLIDNLDHITFSLEFPHKNDDGTITTLQRSYNIPRAAFDELGDLKELWSGDRSALLDALELIDKERWITERDTFSMCIPSSLPNYKYREDNADDFSLWNNDVNVGGMERLNEDSLYSINHASLLAEEELSGFSVRAVKRLYERDYPAASGRTDTYEELHIGLLYNDIWYDFWLDLRYGSENDLMELVKSVQFYVDPAEQSLPEFTQEEIDSARAVVEEYYRALIAKDDNAYWKTMTKQTKPDNTSFLKDVDVEITLLAIDFDQQDPMRESYVKNGRGEITHTSIENVIVFKIKFNVEYTGQNTAAWNEGEYTNWSMILIREDKDSSWLIDDQGY